MSVNAPALAAVQSGNVSAPQRTISTESGRASNPIKVNGQALTQQQLEMADIQLSKDGKTLIITPKEDIPVEILKEKFSIADGAFREILKKQYQDGIDNGVFVEQYSRFFGLSTGTRFNYSRALLYSDEAYKIPLDKLKSQR